MQTIYFVSSNPEKRKIAEMMCAKHSYNIEHLDAGDIPEIQGEAIGPIIEHKAREAYKVLQRPIVVSDDGWEFPALKGFPGPYMKSINHWFSSEDFLRLMDGIEDRRANIHEYLAYIDHNTLKVFNTVEHGKILSEARGTSTRAPIMNIVSLDCDKGMTIFEASESGYADNPSRYERRPSAWNKLLAWHREYTS